MSSTDDPKRLLDELGDSGVDRDLRVGLGGLARRVPSEAQLARMAAAVGLEPAATQTKPKVDSSSTAAIKPVTLAAGGVVVTGGVLLALWAFQTPGANTEERAKSDSSRAALTASAAGSTAEEQRRSARSHSGSASARVSEAPATTTASAAPLDASSEPLQPLPGAPIVPSAATAPDTEGTERSPGTPAAPRSSSKSVAPSAVPAGPKPPPAIGITETQILRDARLVLDRDPRSALALSEQHRRDYPNGSFVQERELIAITALVKLGRSGEAAERAARFRSAYPSSPYRARLDRIVP